VSFGGGNLPVLDGNVASISNFPSLQTTAVDSRGMIRLSGSSPTDSMAE
jgi:hypothetical protein